MLDICHSFDVHERPCEGEPVESTTFPGKYRFCQPHQDQLDRIREELERGAWERNVRNKQGAEETCCENPGCSNRPVYGYAHCKECIGGDD